MTRHPAVLRWYLTLAVFVGVLLLLAGTGRLTAATVLADRTMVTQIIVAAFGLFFLLHTANFFRVAAEHAIAREVLENAENRVTPEGIGRIPGVAGWYLRLLVKAYENLGEGEVRQDDLVPVLESRLQGRESLVVLGSNLMITLGLIGTVAGLVIAVAGLEGIMDGLKGDTNRLVAALKTALGGMHSAFYTTLFGAVLGGVFLKLQINHLQGLATETADLIVTTAAVHLLPRLKKTSGVTLVRLAEEVEVSQKAVTETVREAKALLEEARRQTASFGQLASAVRELSERLEGLASRSEAGLEEPLEEALEELRGLREDMERLTMESVKGLKAVAEAVGRRKDAATGEAEVRRGWGLFARRPERRDLAGPQAEEEEPKPKPPPQRKGWW